MIAVIVILLVISTFVVAAILYRVMGRRELRVEQMPDAAQAEVARCVARRRTSTNGRRGAIASGALKRSCRFIASSKTIATPVGIFTESADRSGSSGRAPRRGNL